MERRTSACETTLHTPGRTIAYANLIVQMGPNILMTWEVKFTGVKMVNNVQRRTMWYWLTAQNCSTFAQAHCSKLADDDEPLKSFSRLFKILERFGGRRSDSQYLNDFRNAIWFGCYTVVFFHFWFLGEHYLRPTSKTPCWTAFKSGVIFSRLQCFAHAVNQF